MSIPDTTYFLQILLYLFLKFVPRAASEVRDFRPDRGLNVFWDENDGVKNLCPLTTPLLFNSLKASIKNVNIKTNCLYFTSVCKKYKYLIIFYDL